MTQAESAVGMSGNLLDNHRHDDVWTKFDSSSCAFGQSAFDLSAGHQGISHDLVCKLCVPEFVDTVHVTNIHKFGAVACCNDPRAECGSGGCCDGKCGPEDCQVQSDSRFSLEPVWIAAVQVIRSVR